MLRSGSLGVTFPLSGSENLYVSVSVSGTRSVCRDVSISSPMQQAASFPARGYAAIGHSKAQLSKRCRCRMLEDNMRPEHRPHSAVLCMCR